MLVEGRITRLTLKIYLAIISRGRLALAAIKARRTNYEPAPYASGINHGRN